MPLNPNDKPVKDNPTDVLLIIQASAPLPAAAAAYWQAVRAANGAAGAQQAAYAALEAAVGDAQARDIADHTQPFNFAQDPAPPLTRSQVQVKAAVLQLTPLEELDTRRTSWSSAHGWTCCQSALSWWGMGKTLTPGGDWLPGAYAADCRPRPERSP